MSPFIISPQSLKKLEIECTRFINSHKNFDEPYMVAECEIQLALLDEIKRLNELVEVYRKELGK